MLRDHGQTADRQRPTPTVKKMATRREREPPSRSASVRSGSVRSGSGRSGSIGRIGSAIRDGPVFLTNAPSYQRPTTASQAKKFGNRQSSTSSTIATNNHGNSSRVDLRSETGGEGDSVSACDSYRRMRGREGRSFTALRRSPTPCHTTHRRKPLMNQEDYGPRHNGHQVNATKITRDHDITQLTCHGSTQGDSIYTERNSNDKNASVGVTQTSRQVLTNDENDGRDVMNRIDSLTTEGQSVTDKRNMEFPHQRRYTASSVIASTSSLSPRNKIIGQMDSPIAMHPPRTENGFCSPARDGREVPCEALKRYLQNGQRDSPTILTDERPRDAKGSAPHPLYITHEDDPCKVNGRFGSHVDEGKSQRIDSGRIGILDLISSSNDLGFLSHSHREREQHLWKNDATHQATPGRISHRPQQSGCDKDQDRRQVTSIPAFDMADDSLRRFGAFGEERRGGNRGRSDDEGCVDDGNGADALLRERCVGRAKTVTEDPFHVDFFSCESKDVSYLKMIEKKYSLGHESHFSDAAENYANFGEQNQCAPNASSSRGAEGETLSASFLTGVTGASLLTNSKDLLEMRKIMEHEAASSPLSQSRASQQSLAAAVREANVEYKLRADDREDFRGEKSNAHFAYGCVFDDEAQRVPGIDAPDGGTSGGHSNGVVDSKGNFYGKSYLSRSTQKDSTGPPSSAQPPPASPPRLPSPNTSPSLRPSLPRPSASTPSTPSSTRIPTPQSPRVKEHSPEHFPGSPILKPTSPSTLSSKGCGVTSVSRSPPPQRPRHRSHSVRGHPSSHTSLQAVLSRRPTLQEKALHVQKPLSRNPLGQNPVSQNPPSRNPPSRNPLGQNTVSQNPLNPVSQNSLSRDPVSRNSASRNPLSRNSLSRDPLGRNPPKAPPSTLSSIMSSPSMSFMRTATPHLVPRTPPSSIAPYSLASDPTPSRSFDGASPVVEHENSNKRSALNGQGGIAIHQRIELPSQLPTSATTRLSNRSGVLKGDHLPLCISKGGHAGRHSTDQSGSISQMDENGRLDNQLQDSSRHSDIGIATGAVKKSSPVSSSANYIIGDEPHVTPSIPLAASPLFQSALRDVALEQSGGMCRPEVQIARDSMALESHPSTFQTPLSSSPQVTSNHLNESHDDDYNLESQARSQKVDYFCDFSSASLNFHDMSDFGTENYYDLACLKFSSFDELSGSIVHDDIADEQGNSGSRSVCSTGCGVTCRSGDYPGSAGGCSRDVANESFNISDRIVDDGKVDNRCDFSPDTNSCPSPSPIELAAPSPSLSTPSPAPQSSTRTHSTSVNATTLKKSILANFASQKKSLTSITENEKAPRHGESAENSKVDGETKIENISNHTSKDGSQDDKTSDYKSIDRAIGEKLRDKGNAAQNQYVLEDCKSSSSSYGGTIDDSLLKDQTQNIVSTRKLYSTSRPVTLEASSISQLTTAISTPSTSSNTPVHLKAASQSSRSSLFLGKTSMTAEQNSCKSGAITKAGRHKDGDARLMEKSVSENFNSPHFVISKELAGPTSSYHCESLVRPGSRGSSIPSPVASSIDGRRKTENIPQMPSRLLPTTIPISSHCSSSTCSLSKNTKFAQKLGLLKGLTPSTDQTGTLPSLPSSRTVDQIGDEKTAEMSSKDGTNALPKREKVNWSETMTSARESTPTTITRIRQIVPQLTGKDSLVIIIALLLFSLLKKLFASSNYGVGFGVDCDIW